MANPYCEKHEWPGGMPSACPDCAELQALENKIRLYVEQRDAIGLRLEKEQLKVGDLTQKLDHATAENKTLALALKEEMEVSKARALMVANLEAEIETKDAFQKDTVLQVDAYRKAFEAIRQRGHEWLCPQSSDFRDLDCICDETWPDPITETRAEPWTQEQKEALAKVADTIIETRKDTSPVERPCCVEAYARGYAVGRHHESLHQPKGKDILGSLPDIQEVCGHCWGEGSHHVVGGPREKCEFCDGTGKA